MDQRELEKKHKPERYPELYGEELIRKTHEAAMAIFRTTAFIKDQTIRDYPESVVPQFEILCQFLIASGCAFKHFMTDPNERSSIPPTFNHFEMIQFFVRFAHTFDNKFSPEIKDYKDGFEPLTQLLQRFELALFNYMHNPTLTVTDDFRQLVICISRTYEAYYNEGFRRHRLAA
ncbi:MAG TPA: hypothetical protein VJJ80_01630 [Patescibacteria group bacterium]|nr:hypothetical protein [Patescibacteria group bacterium]